MENNIVFYYRFSCVEVSLDVTFDAALKESREKHCTGAAFFTSNVKLIQNHTKLKRSHKKS